MKSRVYGMRYRTSRTLSRNLSSTDSASHLHARSYLKHEQNKTRLDNLCRDRKQCCQPVFFNARFNKFGIFENDLALKISRFMYCLAFFYKNSYLLFGIRNFEIY